MTRSLALLLFILLFSLPQQLQAQTSLEFDEAGGLFKIRHNTSEVVSTQFVFWRGEWTWTDMGLQVKRQEQAGFYELKGENTDQGFNFDGKVSQASPRSMIWALKVSESQNGAKDLFGGMSFQINKQSLEQDGFVPTITLLPNNMGWQMVLTKGGTPLTVLFNKPLYEIFFERGNESEIRAYFFKKNATVDVQDLTLTVTLPENGEVMRSPSERLAQPSEQNWFKNIIHWNHSPVDLSFLNTAEKPAGKRGFLKVDGEKLVFADGTPARFWGTNLTADALFHVNPRTAIVNQAKRLSKLGFNLVRLHHHDSGWVDPNVFGFKKDNTLTLEVKNLETLDWWIKCLRDEGIYVWLDLHVGREFTNKDGIKDFEEMASIPGAAQQGRAKGLGFSYLNTDVQERMKAFNEYYLNHVNPYTSLAYKNDPAIIAMLITNENDMTVHFGNMFLPDKNLARHGALYMSEAKAFAAKHGLDANATWQSWLHGPSKLFLSDLEFRFNEKMIGHLRGLGVKHPLVTTNYWGDMSLAGLPSLSIGDIIDAHAYGRANFLQTNPRFTPNIIHWIGAAFVSGKPLTVTEWNLEPFPAFDRFALPAYVASIGSLQNWSGMMQYAYSQNAVTWEGTPHNWQSYNDPAFISTFPVAALLYRQGHVKEAQKTYHLTLKPNDLMGKEISPATSQTIRTVMEQSKFRVALPAIKELPWMQASKTDNTAIAVTEAQDFLAKDSIQVCSDTQEICRNWKDGVFTVNTPLSQIASGWIGGKDIQLKNIHASLKNASASVAVQSLDSQSIEASGKILISLAAQSMPLVPDKIPFLSEPMEGRLTVKAREGLKAYSLDAQGEKTAFPVKMVNGAYEFVFDPKVQTYWLILE